jgi:hypothetical protein
MAQNTSPEGAGAQAPAPQAPLPSTDEWSQGFYSTPTGEAADTTTATPRPTNTPTKGFFDRLLHGVDGKSRLKEVARSIPRGLANVGNALVKTGAEAGAAALDAADLGGTEAEQDDRRKRAKNATAVSQEEMDAVYGSRSDDPLASFTETAVQGASAMLLFSAGGLGVVGSAVATDAVAFNPYEAGLSEIAAQYGDRVPGIGGIIKAAGELGTVDEQDNFLTSRIKRAVEGGIVGMALDGVVWGAKKVLAVKRGDAVAVKEADKALQGIVDGTHTPKDSPVVARPTEDGQWELVGTKESPKVETSATPTKVSGFRGVSGNRHPLEPGYAGATFITPDETVARGYATQGGREAEGTLVNLEADLHNPAHLDSFRDLPADKDLGEHITDLREQGHDGLIIKQGHGGHPEVAIFNQEPITVKGPKFADRAEAEAQAVTMNVHMAEKAAAEKPRLFTPEQVAKHDEIADRLVRLENADDAAKLVEGTDFNFQYLGGSARVNAQIEAMSEQFRSVFDRARKTQGVSNDATIKAAERLAKQYGMRDFATMVSGTAKDVQALSVKLLLGNRAVEQLGERLSTMAALRRQRPHDPVLAQEARELLQTHLELARDVSGVNSEVGRSLQVLQARGRPEVKAIKIGDVATEEAKGAKPKVQPSTSVYDKMTDDEIDAALRMYERAGGSPRNAQAVIDGTQGADRQDP